ncbi:hypothetical protein COOONC_02564 [Cooperia oncophora]
MSCVIRYYHCLPLQKRKGTKKGPSKTSREKVEKKKVKGKGEPKTKEKDRTTTVSVEEKSLAATQNTDGEGQKKGSSKHSQNLEESKERLKGSKEKTVEGSKEKKIEGSKEKKQTILQKKERHDMQDTGTTSDCSRESRVCEIGVVGRSDP